MTSAAVVARRRHGLAIMEATVGRLEKKRLFWRQFSRYEAGVVGQHCRITKLVDITDNSVEQRLGRLIKIGSNTFPQPFDPKLTAASSLHLDDAISVEEQAIARRKLRFRSLKMSVRNNPYRRSGGIRACDGRLHFARASAHL